MRIFKKETFVLFLGDIIFFFLSLWLSLFLRYGHFPSKALLYIHLVPFSILFAVWLVVFFIAGLYEKHTLILKGKLPSAIFNAQLINSVVAVAFFYIIPYFGITPKTVIFIYLIVSFFLILFWRLYGTLIFGRRRGPRQSAILIGTGNEMKELLDEVNGNSHYDIKFISSIDVKDLSAINIQEDIVGPIYENNIKIVAVDFSHENVSPLLPHLYNLIFSKVRFIDSHRIYEDIFDRVPLSLVNYSWFLENISVSPKFTYDFLKRVMDILISLPLLLVPIVALPFVWVARKMEGNLEVFTFQKRVGQNNQIIELMKFGTMLFNDQGDWQGKGRENKVTKVGAFLRKTRLDEFPQLWNVIRGDISLIGPRSEFPEAVSRYEKELPYYNIRHLIKPGLSGWAQIYSDPNLNPHHDTDVSKTKNKLSYDIFYIKNRSFWLDIKISLKTVRELLSRRGV